MKLKTLYIALACVIVAASFLAACATSTPAPGPTPTSAPDTSAQRAAGKVAYDKYCANCHGNKFTNGRDPLSKAALARFGTAQSLYDYQRRTMPPKDPAAVSDQENLDMIGYMLETQGLITSGQVVSADTIATIKLAN